MKRSLSHTVLERKYHIIWVPKRRRKVVFGKLRRGIGAILRRLCETDEAKIRKYIRDQEDNESIEDKYDTAAKSIGLRP